MKAMILAAGLGTRMRPLTDTLPKPLLPVGNSTLIELHLQKLAKAGIREVVINVAYLGEKIEAHLGDGSRYGVRIGYSREAEPLETAGGIKQALPLLGAQPFLLVNGDIWSDYPVDKLVEKAQHLKTNAHLVLVPNPEHHPQGDFHLNDAGRVALEGEPKFTFSGISVLSPALFAAELPSNRLVEILKPEITQGRVSGELYAGQWMDIGTPERLHSLQKLASHQQG